MLHSRSHGVVWRPGGHSGTKGQVKPYAIKRTQTRDYSSRVVFSWNFRTMLPCVYSVPCVVGCWSDGAHVRYRDCSLFCALLVRICSYVDDYLGMHRKVHWSLHQGSHACTRRSCRLLHVRLRSTYLAAWLPELKRVTG